jgi:uncharacterized protein (DUF1499 family)
MTSSLTESCAYNEKITTRSTGTMNQARTKPKAEIALIAALISALLLTGCSGMPETTIDPDTVTELAACPSSPNCVSTADGEDESHSIAPIELDGDPAEAWNTLRGILEADRSFRITASNDRYLRAVATTRILRFKDDVEFLLDVEGKTIGMRSASRVGYSDLGKNRKRMEEIRSRLAEAGVATTAS